jgi:hypothetical protein
MQQFAVFEIYLKYPKASAKRNRKHQSEETAALMMLKANNRKSLLSGKRGSILCFRTLNKLDKRLSYQMARGARLVRHHPKTPIRPFFREAFSCFKTLKFLRNELIKMLNKKIARLRKNKLTMQVFTKHNL